MIAKTVNSYFACGISSIESRETTVRSLLFWNPSTTLDLTRLSSVMMNFRRLNFYSYLCSRPLSLSPTLITMTSLPALVRLAISLLMSLATPEWMAPQSPRSEVTPTIKCLAGLSSGTLMSAFSYRAAGQRGNSGTLARCNSHYE